MENNNNKPNSSELVNNLYDLMLKEGLEQLELKNKNYHVVLKRKSIRKKLDIEQLVNGIKQETNGQSGSKQLNDTKKIKSPLNGTYYQTPSPSSPSFVKEGDTVEPGTTLCIIEAMKVMNEIKAEQKCRILKILVENGRPVSANQDLFAIE